MSTWFPFITDALVRFIEHLGARVSGPMKFRLILQPLMAVVFAVRSGLADARAHRAPYFWALVSDEEHRRYLLRDGWKDIGKVFVAAVLIDVVYQFIVEQSIHPLEALTVAVLLAIVPYLLIRGPANLVASARKPANRGESPRRQV